MMWVLLIHDRFIGLKNNLTRCDFVIAARMHCAVNAITMHVPVLLLSYSEKAKGMAEYVYGTNKTVISLTDFENYHNVADIVKCWNYRSRLDEIQKFRFDLLLQKI